jgi:hypothetical protein
MSLFREVMFPKTQEKIDESWQKMHDEIFAKGYAAGHAAASQGESAEAPARSDEPTRYWVVVRWWTKLIAGRHVRAASQAEAEALALEEINSYGLLDPGWEMRPSIHFAPEIERKDNAAHRPASDEDEEPAS